jgi:outer membrane protein OmpA-like peptidoglycan-associated protein
MLRAVPEPDMSKFTTTLLALPLLLGAAFAVSGCKKPEYPACKKDKHCKEGEKCIDKICQNCKTDTECLGKGPNGENWVCSEFRCQDPALVGAGGTSGGGDLGSPCMATDECMPGFVCRDGTCNTCTQDSECPSGKCNPGSQRCEFQCMTDDDCPMDEICDGGQCIFSGTPPSDEVLCGLEAVYFGFDSPELSPKSQEDLKTAAECIKTQGRQVILEAHADNIGTEEYNILLTDRRGQSVKGFLENLGVGGDSMQVVSKGSLEATGTSEEERSKDRRVQFIWQ